MNKPLITIITICYNCKTDIEETLKSVTEQTYPNIQYIIIDGNSNDGTIDIINKYKHKIDTFISEPDKGIFDAMNKGLQFVKGEWVNFMNAGDRLFDKTTIAKVFSQSYHNIALIYGSTYSDGKGTRIPSDPKPMKYGGMIAGHQSMFYNTSIIGGELYYKTKFKHYGDIELARRLYDNGYQFKRIPVTISYYRGGGFSSIKSSDARKAKFGYLYDHYGIIGYWYGIKGKLMSFFVKSKHTK